MLLASSDDEEAAISCSSQSHAHGILANSRVVERGVQFQWTVEEQIAADAGDDGIDHGTSITVPAVRSLDGLLGGVQICDCPRFWTVCLGWWIAADRVAIGYWLVQWGNWLLFLL